VAGCAAAASVALIGAGLALAYVDRHLVPASLTDWTFSGVSGQVVNMARLDLGELGGRERAAEPRVLVPVDGHRRRDPEVPAV
jgi:hypothetical protein